MRGEYYTLTRWSSRGFRHRGFPSQFYGNGHSGAWGPRLVGAAPAPPPPDRPVSTSAAGGHTTVCRRPSRRHTPPTSSSCLWFIPARTVHLRSEEHTSELQSLRHLVCRLLLEKK